MPLEELTPSHIVKFGGWYARGPSEVCPLDHFDIADNLRFFPGGMETRYGTNISISPNGVRRFFAYAIEGQADRVIYLDLAGQLFDSLYPGAAILTIPGMIDFSMIVLNDRAYLSPHNRITGMPGQKVYIYNGAGVPARPAAGLPPSGFILSATQSALAGNVEAGLHIYAVAYETESGFITRPGPLGYAQHTAIGDFQTHLSNVQPGPPGTVARHILATHIIEPTQWDEDIESPEMFFVEGGVIPDNITTVIDVNFYDSQLLRSADYLKDEMIEIPAVLGFTKFAGSLVGWAPNVEPSSVYISKAGEPESISLIEGGIEVDPATGGGVKNCVEYRGAALIIHKGQRAYTTSNNGEEPAYWKVDSLDSAIGTEVFGVAAILDEEGNTVDRYVIASRKGLIAYEGNYQNVISMKIEDVWTSINKRHFNKIQVVLDPINEYIVVVAPIGSDDNNTILYCDYSEGLDPQNVRWSKWTFPYLPNCVGLDVNLDLEPVLKIGSNSHLYEMGENYNADGNLSIPNPTFRTAYVGDNEVAVNQYGGIRLRAVGQGALNLQFSGLDDAIEVAPPSLLLSASPARLLQREFNLLSQLGRLKIWTQNYGEQFRFTRISIYHTPAYFDEPV